MNSVSKRSSSLDKSFKIQSEYSSKDSNKFIYLTEIKNKKIDKSIHVPLNSFRELSLFELLDEAIDLLKENKTKISDQ